jgi:hypothetical protein
MCNHKTNIDKDSRSDSIDSVLITYFCGLVLTNVAIRCERIADIQQQHPQNIYGYSFPAGTPDELIDAYFEGDSVPDLEVEIFPPDLIDTFIVDNKILDKIDRLLKNKTSAPDFSGDSRMYVTVKKRNNNKDNICIDTWSRVKYNGKASVINEELIFLFRYYSGYYTWFNEDYLLDLFPELEDSVFYKKVLEQIRLKNL